MLRHPVLPPQPSSERTVVHVQRSRPPPLRASGPDLAAEGTCSRKFTAAPGAHGVTRPVRARRVVTRAMVTQAEWTGTQAAAADSSSTLCDAWAAKEVESSIKFSGIHHVAVICASLERSLEFYCGLLGLTINKERPHQNLPYRGAWLWTGPEMIHLMELPNPDPMENRADHGGRDRHACFGVEAVAPISDALKARGIPFTMSKSGRAAIFFRDPDMNTIECVELPPWR